MFLRIPPELILGICHIAVIPSSENSGKIGGYLDGEHKFLYRNDFDRQFKNTGFDAETLRSRRAAEEFLIQRRNEKEALSF